MGNIIPKSVADVKSPNSGGMDIINIDDIDLSQINDKILLNKAKKESRKTEDYKILRKIVRAGIKDNKKRKQIWLKATNVTENDYLIYKNADKKLFDGIDMSEFPEFPMFGSACVFQDKYKYKCQKVLLVLAVEHYSVLYCPQIGYLCETFFKKGLDEHECFGMLNNMVSYSKKNNWYFKIDFGSSLIRIKTFMSIFEENVKLVSTFIKEHNIDISNVLSDAISSMFIEYLNDATFERVIDTFVVEGYKILFRIGVALLNNAKTELLKVKNIAGFKKVLIMISKKLKPDELCQRAFTMYLTRNKFQKLEDFHNQRKVQYLRQVNEPKQETYVRRWPTFNKQILSQSSILTKKEQFLQLWVWLPPGCHVGEYTLLYNAMNDGYKLDTLYQKCTEHHNIIILIKSTKNEIFGGFIKTFGDKVPAKKFVRDPKIFFFILQSNSQDFNKKCFRPKTIDHYYHNDNDDVQSSQLKNMRLSRDPHDDINNNNNNNDNDNNAEQKGDYEQKTDHNGNAHPKSMIPKILSGAKALIIGDGDKNCLYLDDRLNHGISQPSKTFGSTSLCTDDNNTFQVSTIEAWSIEF